MDANKYRTAYDQAQAVQHEVWTELCQHLEHAPDAQLLSDYTATLVYTLDKDRRERPQQGAASPRRGHGGRP